MRSGRGFNQGPEGWHAANSTGRLRHGRWSDYLWGLGIVAIIVVALTVMWLIRGR